MDARNIYARVVSGKTVTVRGITESNFKSLRTQLHRQHKVMREIGGTELALVSKYDAENQIATYKVDARKPRMQFLVEVDGEVVGLGHELRRETDSELTDLNGQVYNHGAEISGSLEPSSQEGECNPDLPEQSAHD